MRSRNETSRIGFPGIARAGRPVIVLAIIWSLAWKGTSMWHAARNGSKPWFIALLLTNTLGVLDALYLFGVDGHHRREELREQSILEVTGEPEQGDHAQET